MLSNRQDDEPSIFSEQSYPDFVSKAGGNKSARSNKKQKDIGPSTKVPDIIRVMKLSSEGSSPKMILSSARERVHGLRKKLSEEQPEDDIQERPSVKLDLGRIGAGGDAFDQDSPKMILSSARVRNMEPIEEDESHIIERPSVKIDMDHMGGDAFDQDSPKMILSSARVRHEEKDDIQERPSVKLDMGGLGEAMSHDSSPRMILSSARERV